MTEKEVDALIMQTQRFLSAIGFITEKHGEQKRKFSSQPYIAHPIATGDIVVEYLAKYDFCDEEKASDLLIAAICHDLLEDTDTTQQEIAEKFGAKVAEYVFELTDDDSKIAKFPSKNHYYLDKMKTMSSEAIFLKLCDRYQNILSLKDIDYSQDELGRSLTFAKRYAAYTIALVNSMLKEDLPLKDIHLDVIDAILMELIKE